MAVALIDLQAQREVIRADLEPRLSAVMAHGKFILGPEVNEFERELADKCGARYCVGVSSGTDALLMALMAIGISRGDAVFLPAFTFPATAEVVALLGATPVFVDVNEGTFNIDSSHLHETIIKIQKHSGLIPKAIMAVDLFGLPAAYDEIRAIASEFGLRVIGDAAQSLGAEYLRGDKVGVLADVTATSFFPAKPLGCYGDGGAIFTDDEELAALFVSIRAHGKASDRYDIVRLGLNARLDTIQAAILQSKMTVFDAEIERRRAISLKYDAALSGYVHIPEKPEGILSAWAQYTIRTERRDHLKNVLSDANIGNAIYYPKPLHHQTAYVQNTDILSSLPVSEALCKEVISIPIHPYMSDNDIDMVVETIKKGLH